MLTYFSLLWGHDAGYYQECRWLRHDWRGSEVTWHRLSCNDSLWLLGNYLFSGCSWVAVLLLFSFFSVLSSRTAWQPKHAPWVWIRATIILPGCRITSAPPGAARRVLLVVFWVLVASFLKLLQELVLWGLQASSLWSLPHSWSPDMNGRFSEDESKWKRRRRRKKKYGIHRTQKLQS